jgi:lipoprotein signal peptidase
MPREDGKKQMSFAVSYRWIAFFVIAINFTIIDLITKYFTFEMSPKDIIPGVLGLKYVFNKGIIWGLFQQGSILFLIIPAFAIPLIILMFKNIHLISPRIPLQDNQNNPSVLPETDTLQRTQPSLLFTIGFGLILAGALGNLYDRIIYKGVRDFIDFYLINWPIFNLADAYITISAGLIIINVLKKHPHPQK